MFVSGIYCAIYGVGCLFLQTIDKAVKRDSEKETKVTFSSKQFIVNSTQPI